MYEEIIHLEQINNDKNPHLTKMHKTLNKRCILINLIEAVTSVTPSDIYEDTVFGRLFLTNLTTVQLLNNCHVKGWSCLSQPIPDSSREVDSSNTFRFILHILFSQGASQNILETLPMTQIAEESEH